jgi:hypothetical protein
VCVWEDALRFRCGHERFQAIPFRISEIRIVASTVFDVDRLRDYLFKRALRDLCPGGLHYEHGLVKEAA